MAQEAWTAGATEPRWKDDGASRGDVDGDRREGDLHLLDRAALQVRSEELAEALALDEAPREDGEGAVVEEVLLRDADRVELGVEDAPRVGVEGPDEAADGGAGDEGDRDLLLLEDAQDADLRETAGAAAAEREADLRRHVAHRDRRSGRVSAPASGGEEGRAEAPGSRKRRRAWRRGPGARSRREPHAVASPGPGRSFALLTSATIPRPRQRTKETRKIAKTPHWPVVAGAAWAPAAAM